MWKGGWRETGCGRREGDSETLKKAFTFWYVGTPEMWKLATCPKCEPPF